MDPDFYEQGANELDNIIPTRGYHMVPMVGIGGSAGSVAALQSFFQKMPPDSGFVFIVILHLSPVHHSTMADLLGRCTSMPVVQAEDAQKVAINHVYVIPPGKLLTTTDGHLRLSDLEYEKGKRVAIDVFFRSLADTHGPHSAAIVLSGADGDGAIGIKRIKERGGLTVTQDPDEAEHSSMPRMAMDTGMIDWVLEVKEMPERLVQYFSREKLIRLPPEDGPPPVHAPKPSADDGEAALRDVLVFLRSRTGRDFSYYKRATILRRIGRRMQVNGVDDLPAYLAYLRANPGEAGALLQDLLISVTNFFRDRDSFEAIENLIPSLFKDKSQTDTVRVWVPACATGEEAYSMAILLLEYARRQDWSPVLQVFACDLDEEAIQRARAGLYTPAIAADVSEDRLQRFFIKEAAGYRVRRELREMVLFANHDLLKDAPFSRMDLISCRNLLIYLNREAQNRALETFHFSLRPGGLLFLGSSESVEETSPLFNTLDKKNRLYVHKPSLRPGLPVPSGPSTLFRALEAQERTAAQAPAIHGRSFVMDAAVAFHGTLGPSLDRATLADMHFKLLERIASPSILVNADYDVVHLSPTAGRFLEVPGAEATINLLRLIHPMLRTELRSALFRAAEASVLIESFDVPAELGGESVNIDIRVSPASEIAPGYLLVVFDRHQRSTGASPINAETLSSGSEPVVHQLERQLELVKGHLRETVEQHEASTEEMKASNEELQAMNEELRSATEELETSREELQSINEELSTVNQEMKVKMEEIAHANSDLQNLMASTSIATVFLDRELKITRYTPTARELFNVIPTDVGRPVGDLKQKLDYPDMIANAEKVLRSLVPIEREVRDNGHWYLARLQPYRTLEDHIAGVVLTCVDVTERHHAKQALADDLRYTERLRKVSEKFVSDEDQKDLFKDILAAAIDLMSAETGTLQLLHPTHRTLNLLATQGIEPSARESFLSMEVTPSTSCGQAVTLGRRINFDYEVPENGEPTEMTRRHREMGIVSAQSTPLVARTGRLIGVITTHWKGKHRPHERAEWFLDLLARQASDAIERLQIADALRETDERMRIVIESAKDYAIFTLDTQRTVKSWTSGAEAMFGYSSSEIIGQSADILFIPEDRAKGDPELESRMARDEGRAGNERWHLRKDGAVFYGSGSVMPLRDRNETLLGYVKIIRDLTESKRTQEELSEQMNELKRFNEVTLGREMRIVELKNEINQFCDRLGESKRYHDESAGNGGDNSKAT